MTLRKVGFLEDDKGHRSSMRLMSMIALIASICFGVITVKILPTDSEYSESRHAGMYITFGFLLAAFAPKALQKFAENMPMASGTREEVIISGTSETDRLIRQNALLQERLDALSRRIDANSSFINNPAQTEEFAQIVPDAQGTLR